MIADGAAEGMDLALSFHQPPHGGQVEHFGAGARRIGRRARAHHFS